MTLEGTSTSGPPLAPPAPASLRSTHSHSDVHSLTPTKQHFVSCAEVLRDSVRVLLLLELLDVEVLPVEPPAAEDEPFVLPLARRALVLLVHVGLVFLAPDGVRLASPAHA